MRESLKNFMESKMGVLALTVILFIIMLLLYVIIINLDLVPVLMILACAYAFLGWKALTKITPSLFIWMPLAGWALYFFVKLLLSVAVGYFVAPYQLAKIIRNAVLK